jgi:anti-sigma regulatory factor (Ser/Thr protein kinase)
LAFVGFTGPIILDVPADPAAMFLVRALVGKISERIGFEAEEIDQLVLAVDEACTNVIRHAYAGVGAGRIILTFTPSPDYFEVMIRDFGKGADPAGFEGRDLDELRPGGLGIHFIKSVVDNLEYTVPPGGGTVLKMMKFMPKQEKHKIEHTGQ